MRPGRQGAHAADVARLARIGLKQVGIMAFTLSCNEFIYALTFIQSSENKAVPVGVLTELGRSEVHA